MQQIWKSFDDRLFVLKLTEPVRRMHEETQSRHRKIQFEHSKCGQGPHSLYMKLIDCDLAILREHLEVVDRLCREVWETQGKTITAAFVRAMRDNTIWNTIGGRTGAIRGGIENMAKRTGYAHLNPIRSYLAQEVERLKLTVANRYEAEARELEYKTALTRKPFSNVENSKPNSGIAEGMMENKQSDAASSVRRVSQALPPPSSVGGLGLSFIGPKPTQVPLDHPADYPNKLKPRTDVILVQAARKFADRKHILDLCKHVTSELTPLFCAEVQAKTLRADLALSTLQELLNSLLVYNCDNGNERFRLGQEARKSDEWLRLATQIADVAQGSEAEASAQTARLSALIDCPSAARRMEAYLQSKGMSQTNFASQVGTTTGPSGRSGKQERYGGTYSTPLPRK